MRKPLGLTIDVDDICNNDNDTSNRRQHRDDHRNYHGAITSESSRSQRTPKRVIIRSSYQQMSGGPKSKSNSINIYNTPTFRDEGLSIGRDYMRMEGRTICPKQSFPSFNDFTIYI